MKRCVLDESKYCDGCGACDRCDLDPSKLCDNCCKCLDQRDVDYAKIPVIDVVTKDSEEYLTALDTIEEERPTRIPYEHINPELLEYWEARLKEAEDSTQKRTPLHGVRKRRDHS